MTIEERFWARVDRSGGPESCWPWMGRRNAQRYGQVGFGDLPHKPAHRYAYEMVIGPIPAGLQLDHLCRNPPCVNPDHLEPVTLRENVRRGVMARAPRTHCKRGHELTPDNRIVRPGAVRATSQCRICRLASFRAYRDRQRVLRGLPPVVARGAQSHCKHGHPLFGENVYVWRTKRGCRECGRVRALRYRAEKRAA